MAITSSLDLKMLGRGFVIETESDLLPRFKPAAKDQAGLNKERALYVFALDTLYKFRVEDFQDKFKETKKYIRAYAQKNIFYSSPWLKSKELRLLSSDSESFNDLFYKTLESDLLSYDGDSARVLVKKLRRELSKLL